MAADWDVIRAEYENGVSLRALAAKYGISKSVIGERKHKEQWDVKQRTDTRTASAIQEVPNRDVNAAVRVANAIKFRAKKLTYQEIANLCGYDSARSCQRAIQRELQRIVVENVEELRREESHMLDIGHAECWELFMDKENKGRLFAWDRILETSRDRRKLMGLDIPVDNALAMNQIIVREVPQGWITVPSVEAPK